MLGALERRFDRAYRLQATGRYAEARAIFLHIGSMLPRTTRDALVCDLRVRSMRGAGSVLRDQGRYASARVELGRALRFAEKHLGPSHIETAYCLNEMGILYKYTAQFTAGRQAYRRALRILVSHRADRDVRATLYHNLGGLAHAQGRYAEGEAWARKSVELRRGARGPRHAAVAADIAALAALVEGRGRYKEAARLYRRAILLFRRAPAAQLTSPRSYELAVNYHNLAGVEWALGNVARAVALYRKALGLKRELLGPGHVDVAITLNNLGKLLAETKRRNESLRLLKNALTIFKRALGSDHPSTKICRQNVRACEEESWCDG